MADVIGLTDAVWLFSTGQPIVVYPIAGMETYVAIAVALRTPRPFTRGADPSQPLVAPAPTASPLEVGR